jgi:hypothetical protein
MLERPQQAVLLPNFHVAATKELAGVFQRRGIVGRFKGMTIQNLTRLAKHICAIFCHARPPDQSN